ncbi:MAG: VWA domain-containing protein [Pirellulaceae bacterium]|nr:VWA domain-containing protein [Planctomycetales bacterium]
MESLKFLTTPAFAVLGGLFVLATAAVSFVGWQRGGYKRETAILEILRFVIVAMVAVTLNQPEWLEEFRPEERPTLVVLADESGSMDTRDVLDPTNPAALPQTRTESIQPWLDPTTWQGLNERFDVVIEKFSSTQTDPKSATDVNQALESVLESHDNLRGVVFLSDGDWNDGEPPARAASQLRVKDTPVFVVATGSDTRLPDVELTRVDAPTFGVVNKTMRIPFTIDSALPRDVQATVTLTPSQGAPITQQVTIPARSQLQDALTWRPEQTGEFELTVNVPKQPEERVEENNQKTVPISIREEALKVLLVESYPRWEYRYLRNALERDPGVDVACLMFHPGLSKVGGGKGYIDAFPATLDQLSQYDVIFLGDVGISEGQLTAEQCRLIKGLVQSQASGLILMPGMHGGHLSLIGSELEELYPVQLDITQPGGWGARLPAQMELTETGRQSLLTKLEDSEEDNAQLWESLPGFQWYAPVLRAKAGTEILARHKSESNQFGRIPLLVTRTFGTGKILFMGSDGAWRWREGVEDKYHYRFWGQVARWMAYQRSMAQGESMRLFYSPDRPQSGDVVTLNANVMSLSGEPLQRGTVLVQVVAPSGKTESVRLTAQGDEWGLFTNNFTPEENGEYKLVLSCRENSSTLNTSLSVQGVVRERMGKPVRLDVLEEIAAITRGKMVKPSEIGGLVNELLDLPEPDPIVRRLRLWCHPLWASTIVGLLGVFWVGRKWTGTI